MTQKLFLIGTDIFLLVVLLLTIYELRLAMVNPLGIMVRVGLCVLAVGCRWWAYTFMEVKDDVGE